MKKNQSGLYRHWKKIATQQQNDFRAASLRSLIFSYIDIKKNVLDLGCGTCDMTLFLFKQKVDVTSIDSSIEMLAIGKKILMRNGYSINKVYRQSLESFSKKYSSHFDQVVCLDVIEHIENDTAAIKYIYKLVKPGGKLFLTVPALSYLYGPKDKDVGHYRRYNKQELYTKISDAGFKITKVRYWNLLGILPTFIAVKLFRKRVSENFRYSNSLAKTVLQKLLKMWFLLIENKIEPLIGLTLFVVAKKERKLIR
ncbi:MAG: methyltransferase domain-containing protein [Patescibacteria group bacterium]